MAKSISKSQLKNLDWLGSVGTEDYEIVQANDLDGIIFQYAEKFKDNLLLNIKKKNVTASGNLEKNVIISAPYELDGKNVIDISLVTYAKFIDKGVKGFRDSSNAPNSPYQFKNNHNQGKNDAFVKSLKNYIKSAKKKISASDIKKYGGTEREQKFEKIADTELNRLIYLIKAFGIKTTNIVTDSVDASFKGLEKEIADNVGLNIAITITR